MKRISNKSALSAKDNLRSNSKDVEELECKRIIDSGKTILCWNFNEKGQPEFHIGEIINSQKGTYEILTNEKVIETSPFTDTYDAFTAQSEKRKKPKENICFSINHHQFNEVVERKYVLADCRIAIFGHAINTYLFDLHYDKNKHFQFIYVDKNNLFTKNYLSIENWLEFEKSVNKIYERSVNLGKNFLSEDENIIMNYRKEEEARFKKLASFLKCNNKISNKENNKENTL